MQISFTEFIDACVQRHEKHPEQAGRIHGVLIPRLHLRPITLTAHQPARGEGRNEAEAPTGPFQVQQQVSSITYDLKHPLFAIVFFYLTQCL